MAAEKAGLTTGPCWVREMSDEAASRALVLNTAQGELQPLDVGLHARNRGLSIREYAKRTGEKPHNIRPRIASAKGIPPCRHIPTESARGRWLCLAEIHAAPHWAWPAVVEKLLEEEWPVEATRKQVGPVSLATLRWHSPQEETPVHEGHAGRTAEWGP